MGIEKAIKISIIFLLGFLSANVLGLYLIYGNEVPSPFLLNSFSINQNSAPFDFIDESQIQVYEDRIVINIENASLSRYAPTGSMLPLLNENSNGIRIVPKSEEDIHVGDIITFKQGEYSIVHRVIEKRADEQGTYFITKGDNNNIADKRIRFEQIKYITIGILW